MLDQREQIIPIQIEEEMRASFLDYAMSVIVNRALPDVRDGLKPVHRRILYAMQVGGYRSNRSFNKCAKIVGEVMGKYHPHGDAAIYDTLVRMAQEWNMRAPLIDGQGNFGSIDGDPPAAMRYTECRLDSIADLMLEDIDKETVNFAPNYDGKEMEPMVLPSAFPNLLVNGSAGIAVGMATNIPPHNLGETIDALVHLIDHPKATLEEIMQFIPGPDFPTGGYICGREGIKEAYTTGRGKVLLRARLRTEQIKGGREAIIVSEIPYQVNKSKLVEDIAHLVRDKKLAGITDVRDESDRDGMRVVLEVRRGDPSQVIINQLYKHTDLQASFGVILLALVDGRPRYLSLLRMLTLYVEHRREVVLRRTRYDLAGAQDRLHIVEGLLIALARIEDVIALIRSSADTDTARQGLMEEFGLTRRQADAILEMRLRTLTALEVDKLEREKMELQEKIAELESILASTKKQYAIIKKELLEVKKKYGDARRTEIIGAATDMTIEDLIAEERVVITITHGGYIKRTPTNLYRKQRRGGKGTIGAEMKEEDWIEHLFVGTTHNYLMFFTDKGMAYWLKVYELPQGGRASRGRPIVNMLELDKDEKVRAVIPVDKFDDERFIVMITKNGQICKNALSLYSNPRKIGIKAINVTEDDALVEVRLTGGQQEIFIATKKGIAVRFHESEVRSMGRFVQGVRAVTLEEGDEVIDMEVLRPGSTILTVCEHGFGKRSNIEEYRQTRRGAKGVINIRCTERNGDVVAVKEVLEDDELILITVKGQTIRFKVSDTRIIGRATQGVKLFDLDDDDCVTAVSRVGEKYEEEGEDDEESLLDDNGEGGGEDVEEGEPPSKES